MREGWTYKKLGDYIKEYSVKNKAGENIPVYSVTNSQGFCKEYFSKEVASEDKTSYKIVPYGFFAYNPSRINVGSIDWQHKEEKVIVSPLYNVFNVSDRILQPYLLYFLKSPATIKYIDTIATGTVRLNLKLSMLKDFCLPVPSISIQHNIVSELDKINELISLKKAQLSDLDALAQSIFYDMFGDPIENEKGWEVKRLKDIVADDCSISYGIVQPGDGVDNGVPVVRPVDMTHTFVKRSGLKQTTKEISDSYKRTILKGNEILMCVRGTTGLVALATEDIKDCNVTRGVTPIECNADNSRLYIYHLLLTAGIQQYIANYTKGIALKQINMQDVREIPLIIPPLPLQQDFAKRIELIEQQKAQISSTIKDLETLLASRMQYWFD